MAAYIYVYLDYNGLLANPIVTHVVMATSLRASTSIVTVVSHVEWSLTQ